MDSFLIGEDAFLLDKRANKMVKWEIRSRAKKWCVGRSLTISIQQLALSNQPEKTKAFNHKGHEGTQRKNSETSAKRGLIAETRANLGWIGMAPLKSTPIWDDPQGGRGTPSPESPTSRVIAGIWLRPSAARLWGGMG
jgi:hypothetical protein